MSRIALLAPYHGGSHAQWVDGLQQASRHAVDVFKLPARFWKWRMHGGAVTLAGEFMTCDTDYDLIVATSMLDVSTFLSLTRTRTWNTPIAVYFHENQLTYPPPPGQKRDLHYGFINYASALAADRVFFNSAYHRQEFLEELPRLLKHFPDFNELHTIEAITAKSDVLPLGMNLRRFDPHRPANQAAGPLRILWNHRWEYDKQPKRFFDVLYQLTDEGVPFELIVLGESFRQKPTEFIRARRKLDKQIVHFGFAEDESEYARYLWQADVNVSCAIQDFFGGSTVEAMYCDCYPLLPNRLNYPMFIPEELRDDHLYDSRGGLYQRLRMLCFAPEQARTRSLRESVAPYEWGHIVSQYDDAFERMIADTP